MKRWTNADQYACERCKAMHGDLVPDRLSPPLPQCDREGGCRCRAEKVKPVIEDEIRASLEVELGILDLVRVLVLRRFYLRVAVPIFVFKPRSGRGWRLDPGNTEWHVLVPGVFRAARLRLRKLFRLREKGESNRV